MHSSSLRLGSKFLNIYGQKKPLKILEIGSYDVNGSLRKFSAENVEWVGVDLESGPGVDIVLKKGEKLPFDDSSFDLVISSSVIEHDTEFWKSIPEMARVLKSTGFLYINAPSNGPVHRYPVDVFRFYPDAANSFLSLIRMEKKDAKLVESFTIKKDPSSPWNDFVSVYGAGKHQSINEKLHFNERASNIFINGVFIEDTFVQDTEDQTALNDAITRMQSLELEISEIQSSLSWRITKPARLFLTAIKQRAK